MERCDVTPASLAVFASGSGTNLQAVLDKFGADGRPDSSARVALVVSDRAEARALERAQAAGVPTRTLAPKEFGDCDAWTEALLSLLRGHDIDLIALAGYLKLVPDAVVQEYRGRIVNIHPAPLPTFGGPAMYGQRVHEAVLASGVRVSGPTIHFVDERYDTGPIIAQWPVPVRADDTAEALAARVLRFEHKLYPAVIRALARGQIELQEDGRVRTTLNAGDDDVGFELTDVDTSLASLGRMWGGPETERH
ncbi:MAG: phosphoribosylglycinamide formyltransferase [Gemmatimonadota bacterium]